MIDTTVNIFNSYDQNLQFTIELPLNNSISFLDIKLIVNEQRYIVTNWYQKKILSSNISEIYGPIILPNELDPEL